jgi:UPF0716 protein FxsA
MPLFFLLFVLFPFIELAVMIKVGGIIGVPATLLLVLAGFILGGTCMRLAGLAVALRAREMLSRGEQPEAAMLEGMFIALGGLLLLLPGFISDVFGLLCLLPPVRRLLAAYLLRRIGVQAQRQRAFAEEMTSGSGQSRGELIEGEFERRDS